MFDTLLIMKLLQCPIHLQDISGVIEQRHGVDSGGIARNFAVEVMRTFESKESLGDFGEPPGLASSTMVTEILNSFTCSMPCPLVEALVHVHVDEATTSRVERRSGNLDKNIKSYNIPTAQHTKYMLAMLMGSYRRTRIQ